MFLFDDFSVSVNLLYFHTLKGKRELMKKNYIILLAAIFFSGIMIAQEAQKNFINYQGVARNGADQLMANESMTIGIALKMGSATGASAYAENHSVTTDANGVFSLKIGNGESVSGAFNTIPWGSEATFVTVLVNGSEIGTTEMMAVPYALSSGDGAQQADEVPYDNSVSGLSATDTQQAIDELVGSGAVDADADPTNEIQDISLSGTDLSISEGSTIDLSPIIPPGGTDDQNAAEVPFDNTASGLTATDAQTAIDELATSGLVDTDDQDLSLSGTTLQITDGASVDLAPIIPAGGTDDQNAAEVPFDNVASGLTASDTQAAIDELALASGSGGSPWDVNEFGLNRTTGVVNIGSRPAADSNSKFFVFSSSPGVRNGIYSYVLHPGFKVGVSANALSRDDENTFGMRSNVTSEANATSWAYRADMNASGTGTQYGFFSRIHSGTGLKYGLYTDGEDRNYFSGDLGIGTEFPAAKLDVDGGIRSRDLSGTGQRNVVADADGNLVVGGGSSQKSVYHRGPWLAGSGGSAGSVTATARAIGPAMNITKLRDDTTIEVTLNSRFGTGAFSGATGIIFQIRINGLQSGLGVYSTILGSNKSEFLSFFDAFQDLPAGNHTIQIFARTNSGTSTNVYVDPGGWGGRIIAKETL